MKNIFRNLKYRTKIIMLCVFILLINSGIVGKLYYNYASKDTLSNFYQSSEDISNQMNQHMSERFRDITKRVFTLSNNNSFYIPLNIYLSDPNSANYAKLLGIMADTINDLRSMDDYIHSIFVYAADNDFNDFTRIQRHDFSFSESYMYEYFEENPEDTIAWFPGVTSPIFMGNDEVIPVVYKFRLGRENLYIVVSLSQTAMVDYLKDTYSSYDKIFIVDKEGNNIVNFTQEEAEVLSMLGEEDLLEEKSVCKEVDYKGEKYIGTYTVIKANGWQIYKMKSEESLLGNLRSLRTYMMGVIIVSVMISIIASMLFAHSITTPLAQLVTIMDKAINHEFHVQFPYPYEDEVGNLAKSFNYMVKEIDHLITELNINIEALKEEKENVRIVQAGKRKAELKALQAQINPHFLYNTLNAITWQAVDQGASDISVMSNSLGKFFRIALSKGSEIITIGEELEHITSYLAIQEIRYKSKMVYRIEVEDDIRELYIIKLVLQPLVENAIYHGIKLKETPGFIHITVHRLAGKDMGPVIKICVADNGPGIEDEKLNQINNNLKSGIIDRESGYGIYNVNERLRLYYGQAFGLTYESKYGEGTRAVMIIPVQTTREG